MRTRHLYRFAASLVVLVVEACSRHGVGSVSGKVSSDDTGVERRLDAGAVTDSVECGFRCDIEVVGVDLFEPQDLNGGPEVVNDGTESMAADNDEIDASGTETESQDIAALDAAWSVLDSGTETLDQDVVPTDSQLSEVLLIGDAASIYDAATTCDQIEARGYCLPKFSQPCEFDDDCKFLKCAGGTCSVCGLFGAGCATDDVCNFDFPNPWPKQICVQGPATCPKCMTQPTACQQQADCPENSYCKTASGGGQYCQQICCL